MVAVHGYVQLVLGVVSEFQAFVLEVLVFVEEQVSVTGVGWQVIA